MPIVAKPNYRKQSCRHFAMSVESEQPWQQNDMFHGLTLHGQFMQKILCEMKRIMVTDRVAISDASSEEQVGPVCTFKPEILFRYLDRLICGMCVHVPFF